eukprot:1859246-Rhodomonas_salina.1
MREARRAVAPDLENVITACRDNRSQYRTRQYGHRDHSLAGKPNSVLVSNGHVIWQRMWSQPRHTAYLSPTHGIASCIACHRPGHGRTAKAIAGVRQYWT